MPQIDFDPNKHTVLHLPDGSYLPFRYGWERGEPARARYPLGKNWKEKRLHPLYGMWKARGEYSLIIADFDVKTLQAKEPQGWLLLKAQVDAWLRTQEAFGELICGPSVSGNLKGFFIVRGKPSECKNGTTSILTKKSATEFLSEVIPAHLFPLVDVSLGGMSAHYMSEECALVLSEGLARISCPYAPLKVHSLCPSASSEATDQVPSPVYMSSTVRSAKTLISISPDLDYLLPESIRSLNKSEHWLPFLRILCASFRLDGEFIAREGGQFFAIPQQYFADQLGCSHATISGFIQLLKKNDCLEMMTTHVKHQRAKTYQALGGLLQAIRSYYSVKSLIPGVKSSEPKDGDTYRYRQFVALKFNSEQEILEYAQTQAWLQKSNRLEETLALFRCYSKAKLRSAAPCSSLRNAA